MATNQLPVYVTGIWLRRIGNDIEVLAQISGEWVPLISEHYQNSMSHIIEPLGIRACYQEHMRTRTP